MKYFTPDLLARFGSPDARIADAAQEDWEQAHAKYLEHLKAIRLSLPKAVQFLLKRFYLHDARVLALAQNKRSFSIFLQLNTPRDQGLQLTYWLASAPQVLRHPALAEEGTPLAWLYDEIDGFKEEPFAVFTHSILFTAGWELQFVFHRLTVRRYRKVLGPVIGPLVGGIASGLDALQP